MTLWWFTKPLQRVTKQKRGNTKKLILDPTEELVHVVNDVVATMITNA